MYSYESGAILYGKLSKFNVNIKNSNFRNNTAVQGSIFIFEEFAEVLIVNCTFENNFALQSGIGDVRSSSQLEFINCTIAYNYAIANPISVIYEGYSILTFNNCSIFNNFALTKDQVLTEFNTQWNKLCYVPNLFKSYVNSNNGVLLFSFSEVILNPVYSKLNIINGTIIKNQQTLIYSIISDIVVENSIISNISIIDEPCISLVFSSITINNVEIIYINSTEGFDFIQSIENWTINVAASQFINSNSNFINTISTAVFIENSIFENISSIRSLISIDSSSNSILSEIKIENCASQSNWIILIKSWQNVELIQINTADVLNDIPLYIINSKIVKIEDLSIINWNQAIIFENTIVIIFKDSIINSNGGSIILFGGAIRSMDSDISISNWTFSNNKAQSGGAISFEWSSLTNWNLYLNNILFDSNIGLSQGGAIYYNYKRPQFNKITLKNNKAIYGNEIASYAVRVRFNDSDSDKLSITDIASGIKYSSNITFKLLDYDNQTMILNNINQVELSSSNASQLKLKGTNTGLLKNGVAIFSNFIAISNPGSSNILISMKWKAIDNNKIKTIFGSELGSSSIVVNFRYWQPGEIRMGDNTCNQWATGTYSLIWNSTSCNQWITNTACQGEYKISVDSGYWRNTKNSTYIAEWLYKDACKGGYSDGNEHPVNCNDGYSGILWNDWQIFNGTKYERVSDYQCEKWPNPIYNGIRVIGLLLLVFIFLLILIIINIRKTKESEMSILIRIMTNYLQLLTTSMSFNVQYPSVLLDALGPANQIGSTSQAFLSFDCFVTDTQLHGPFPSNAFFKLFLTGVLPFILIGIISLIWVWVRLINQSLMKNLTRNIVISFISIVFFLHPKLASTSVSIFECVKIDEGIYKVRIDTGMDCYSRDHIYWWFLLGVPILAFWVIFLPVLSLVLLIKNFHKGDDNKIKMYFLILYQGLKANWYYWEFVNSLRKVLILVTFAALATFSPLYRIMLSVIILTITARVQINLNPYKNQKHSEIEMLAIVAGTTTLFSGLVYTSENIVTILNTLILSAIFILNIYFILEWTLMFLITWSERYKFLLKVVFVFELLLCKHSKREKKHNEEDSKQDDSNKSVMHKKLRFQVKNKNKKNDKLNNVFNQNKPKRIKSKKKSKGDNHKSQNHIKVVERGEIDEVVREELDEIYSSNSQENNQIDHESKKRTNNISIFDIENTSKSQLDDFKSKVLKKRFKSTKKDEFDIIDSKDDPLKMYETFSIKQKKKIDKEKSDEGDDLLFAVVSSDFSGDLKKHKKQK